MQLSENMVDRLLSSRLSCVMNSMITSSGKSTAVTRLDLEALIVLVDKRV